MTRGSGRAASSASWRAPSSEDVNGEPVGAVIGAKIIDDTFARAVTKRTGAAVGFYADGARVASGAPEGFDKANLDQITQDLKLLDDNKDYVEKGRSEVRVIGQHLGVVYARLPGEAWELGAGYAVGRLAASVESPLNFLDKANNDDKSEGAHGADPGRRPRHGRARAGALVPGAHAAAPCLPRRGGALRQG